MRRIVLGIAAIFVLLAALGATYWFGMQRGWFTGRRLADYFNPERGDWVNARRIINGTDKANLIAGYGQAYYAAVSYTT